MTATPQLGSFRLFSHRQSLFFIELNSDQYIAFFVLRSGTRGRRSTNVVAFHETTKHGVRSLVNGRLDDGIAPVVLDYVVDLSVGDVASS